MSREDIISSLEAGLFHGTAVCIKDVEHDFPHGKIEVGDRFPITAWLPDYEEGGIYSILLPNPNDPGFFLFRMDLVAFNKWFRRETE